MADLVTYEREGDVAVVSLSSPPVNALGHGLRAAIVEAVERAGADGGVRAIVLIGSDTVFSAGADIKEMGTPAASREPLLPGVIAKLEASTKPVVAAIAGLAMGGGFELAMGAHHRVALEGARLALPEVRLGFLPGAGGTQRLARAVGLERALDMIVSGEPVKADTLAGTPLLAEVVRADLRGAAVKLARDIAEGAARPALIRDLDVAADNAEALLAAARARHAAKAHHMPAPMKIIDCLEAAVKLPIDEGLKFERAAYLELRETPAHRALRHVFKAERATAHIPHIAADTPLRDVSEVGIVGGGTMGRGIAINFLNAGIATRLIETDAERLEAAVDGIAALYQARVDRGRMTVDARERAMACLKPGLEMAELASADMIIEAVFEDMALKKSVFEALDKIARPGAILATNTSTLDVDQIAAATERPQDVVGTHFFSPANVMRLCEVVRGAETSGEVVATAMALARRIGKIAVVSGVCDGFIGNRMLEHYVRMAHTMVEEGARPGEVDKALEAWGMAMGPFRVGDLAGNDIGWAVRKRRYVERPHVRYARIADAICERGRFGQKTGKGWYLYAPGSRVPEPDPQVDEIIAAYRAKKGITPREIGTDEIVERTIYALINEGARILEEGIAVRASDIDVVYLTGYGFPRFRGGPMCFADETGLEAVRARMEEFGRASGDPFWQPAGLISRLIEEGRGFND